MRNAMIIDPKDNVAVAIEPIAKGTAAVWVAGGKEASVRPPAARTRGRLQKVRLMCGHRLA